MSKRKRRVAAELDRITEERATKHAGRGWERKRQHANESRITELEGQVKGLEAEVSLLRAQQWAHWTYTYAPQPGSPSPWSEYGLGTTTGGTTKPIHQGPFAPQGTAR